MTSSPLLRKAQAAETAAFSAAAAVGNPDDLAAVEALEAFQRFDRIARAASAAKLLLARRVDDSGEARRQGMASTADLLAKLSGTSVGQAKSDLDTSKALGGLDETRDALLSGEVSAEQTKVIAGAAKVNPAAQERLLRRAKSGDHRELQDEAQRVKAESDDSPEATHRRIHRNRRLSMWTGVDGTWNLRAIGTVADGALIKAAIERVQDRLFRERASATSHEPREAYAFDALKALTTESTASGSATAGGSTKRPAPQHLALLRLDVSALRRGLVEEGELCEVAGVGPIPVSVAKALLGDAVLKLVITDGVDVLNVTSLTRGPTQAMRYAMLWTSPTCIVEGCSRTICEHDHVNGREWKDTHHTRLDELERPCTTHHDLHTNHGWALVRGKGKRPMVPPGHPDHPTQPGTGPPPPASDQQLRDLARIIDRARAAHMRANDGAPPPPDLVGAVPSLFG